MAIPDPPKAGSPFCALWTGVPLLCVVGIVWHQSPPSTLHPCLNGFRVLLRFSGLPGARPSAGPWPSPVTRDWALFVN